MSPTLAPIVEGHGEVRAVPVLLRRIALEMFGCHVTVSSPWRLPVNLMHREALAPIVHVLAERVGESGGVIVLRDADDDDPNETRSDLNQLLHELAPERAAAAVAVREFEAWFLGSIVSLRSHRSVRDDASFEGDPEGKRDAKGALSAQMTESYRPTLHQPSFAAEMDIQMARSRCPSFNLLVSEVGRLLLDD